MSAMKEIRDKMRSVTATRKITGAMELVAASKMKKAHHQAIITRPYCDALKNIMDDIQERCSDVLHPLFQSRVLHHLCYVVISSKRGLCGGLNLGLFKDVLKDMMQKQKDGVAVSVVLIGKKAVSFFKNIDITPLCVVDDDQDCPSMDHLHPTMKLILSAFQAKNIDAVYLCYNLYKSSLVQIPVIEPLLPLRREEKPKSFCVDYLYDEHPLVILDHVLIRYYEALMYQSVLENYASEQAARMFAMKTATDNAGTMLDDLLLSYNKARQASITQEITEIVNGTLQSA